MMIGVLRLARTARVRWEPVSLSAGVVLMVAGYLVPSMAGAFLLGMLVLCVALLIGIRQQRRGRGPV
jgi:predicted branched-subunit amino acid permease